MPRRFALMQPESGEWLMSWKDFQSNSRGDENVCKTGGTKLDFQLLLKLTDGVKVLRNGKRERDEHTLIKKIQLAPLLLVFLITSF